ncbi:type II 3-dehydroquinate dehydratase [Francisella tularensis]|uniref:3-dehydroquinate dehydratase n=1 Tax=Francisella tularensis subsp. mediasiatica (strain FSC147) TaxID=441952 RepID=AROQ_FRATM|nr:type II 3-dehydroquinate dehydratase [Francisella tularensis]B2SDP9.1 RecName: Full=3-dehydroquinate dehydratase; Short=3-dehydroquinase; AltName: Full=Type II DHQase [Francisella tularensis subsp. mediasiatica FSC147]ACD31263.1 3-dehydroquinate dehydratase [Francisella tularensis subsp. mediasiatica FSC147]MBK2077944.1 type II 3-dehydroquinate dehydratase [Francisella tularensis subsp. mediasiatica]MBK2101835.1 type II 3-dehydroquinate dehydratase [Francisella tularensis subsp. mediasiatica
MDVLVINGPNLNLLGTRQPRFYGHKTLADINNDLLKIAKENNINIDFYQSNHEGQIIDKIQQTAAKIIIINPAAFTHTSVAIRDAFLAINKPFIEIHLSNIYNREEFRTKSFLSDIAYGCIFGFGPNGYTLALIEAINYINMKGE